MWDWLKWSVVCQFEELLPSVRVVFVVFVFHPFVSWRITALSVSHTREEDVESDLLLSIKCEIFSEINSQNLSDDNSPVFNLQFEWLLVLGTSSKSNKRGAWSEMTIDEYSHCFTEDNKILSRKSSQFKSMFDEPGNKMKTLLLLGGKNTTHPHCQFDL